jgi:hypothetical protein
MITQTTINNTVIHAKQWVATFGESLAKSDDSGDEKKCCLKNLYLVNTGIGVLQRYDTVTLSNNILTAAEIKNVINVVNSIING